MNRNKDQQLLIHYKLGQGLASGRIFWPYAGASEAGGLADRPQSSTQGVSYQYIPQDLLPKGAALQEAGFHVVVAGGLTLAQCSSSDLESPFFSLFQSTRATR